MREKRELGWKNIIFYGVGDLYGGGSFMIIGLFFLYFLTDVVGLSPAMAGLVFTLGEVWDAITDPMMGVISDRTRSRFGRRRVYMLVGIIPIFLSFAGLWLPVDLPSEIAIFLFYGSTYLLFNTVFTMVMVPYSALNADMTADYRLRTRLSGTRIIFSQVSTLIAATVPKMIIDGAGSEASGFLIMGLIFGVVYALPFILVYFGTFEELTDQVNEPVTFAALKGILQNRTFRVHMGMYIAAYTAIDILMALFLYFMKYYLEEEGLYNPRDRLSDRNPDQHAAVLYLAGQPQGEGNGLSPGTLDIHRGFRRPFSLPASRHHALFRAASEYADRCGPVGGLDDPLGDAPDGGRRG